MIFSKGKPTLGKRFSLTTILVISIIVVIFCAGAITISTLIINNKLKARFNSVSGIVSVSLRSPLWNLDKDTINDFAEALFKEEGVAYFQVVDSAGPIFIKKSPDYKTQNFDFFAKSSKFITGGSDIHYQGNKVGSFQLALSKKNYQRELTFNILTILGLTVFIIAAFSITSIKIMKYHILKPLRKLEESASMISKENLDAEIDISSQDEIGNLAKAFDEMRQAVKTLVDKLRETNQKLDETNKNLDKKVKERTVELFESEQKLKTVLDNIRRRVYWKGLNGVIEGGNIVFAEEHGFSNPQELKGKKEADIWKRKEVLEMFQRLSDTAINTGKGSPNINQSITDDSGNVLCLNINCSPMKDKKGKTYGVMITYRDITGRMQADEDLKQAKEEAIRANEAKDQFLANVSHEIRTPMNSIIGFTKQALKAELTPELEKYIRRVNSSAEDLKRIIDDILDYSRMESGEMEIAYWEFNLEDVLEGVSNNFKEQLQKKNLRFSIDMETDIPTVLLGDDLRLKQILNNLVNNAIKFTDAGSVSLGVSCIKKDEEKAIIRFSVTDTGCGIAREKLDEVFNPYVQLENSKDKVTKGIGLGLAISKKLVELMHGEIGIDSQQGKGSIFHFIISFGRPSEDEVLKKPRSTEILKDIDLKRLKGKNILAVEDDESSQILVEDILTKAGMTVDVVGNGNYALQMAKSKAYDMVLMDMKIPGMSGLEVARLIRTEKHLANLPIIAVTANAMARERRKCMEAGMNDYLSKPIDSDKLLKRVIRWMPRSKKKTGTDGKMEPSLKWEDGKIIGVLVGLDVRTALVRLKTDLTTYMKSLNAFANKHTAAIDALKNALARKDIEELRDLLHTIKGAASNLGAVEIEAATKDLQSAVKKNQPHLEPFIENLENSLNKVLNSIRSANGLLQTKPPKPRKDISLSIPKLASLLTRAVDLLEDEDNESTKVMDEIIPYLIHFTTEDKIARLRNQMLNRYFKSAMTTLKAIADEMGISL